MSTVGLALSGAVLFIGAQTYFNSNSSTTTTTTSTTKHSHTTLLKRVESNKRKRQTSDKQDNRDLEADLIAEKVSREALENRYEFAQSELSGGSEVGKGAFGRVLRGRDKVTDKLVAVKVIPQKNMTAEAILNEVEVLRRVRGHENIIHLEQVLNCDNEYYIISELCEDGELLQRLLNHGPYSEHTAALLMERLASAVQHIHRCGYVHCDLKPENIVFAKPKVKHNNCASLASEEDSEGLSPDSCRIIDFGLAKAITDFEGSLSYEKIRSCIGTLAYSPPEVVRLFKSNDDLQQDFDVERYDPRKLDTWALGLILYILLFGCHPFDIAGSGDEDLIVKNILNTSPRFNIHNNQTRISTDAKQLIKRLLDPSAEGRLETKGILAHNFVLKHKHAENYLEKLPRSWITLESQERDLQTRVRLDEDAKYRPFLTEDAVDAFVRALLINALVNSLALTEGSSAIDAHSLSDDFLLQAFRIFDHNHTGRIAKADVSNLLKVTGQTDQGIFAGNESETPGSKTDSFLNFAEFKAVLQEQGCAVRQFKSGTAIFSEGDEPQGFFILSRGKCSLQYISDPQSLETHDFSIVQAGSMFGESALAQGRPERAVTVKSITDCEVIYIPKDLFFRSLASSPALQTKIFESARLQQSKRMKDLILYLFAHEPFCKGRFLEKRHYKQGEILYKQGEEARDVYFIEKGLVGAFSSVVGHNAGPSGDNILAMRLAQRGTNDFTGSSVFFQQSKRYSTAQCLTDVDVAVFKREDINLLVKRNRALQFYFEAQAQWRKEQWEQRIADIERGVSEPQLLPILFKEHMNSRDNIDVDGDNIESYAKAIAKMHTKRFLAGETIFRKGDPPNEFYILNSGCAIAEASSDNATVATRGMAVAQLSPGDHFGEQSLLENRTEHATTLRCTVPCEVLCMTKADFFNLYGNGQTAFGRSIESARRIRQHRWGLNLLLLARQDQQLLERKRHLEHNNSSGAPRNVHVASDALTDSEVKVVKIVLRQGEILFSKGDPSDGVYYLHKGEVELVTDSDNGSSGIKPIRGRVLTAGEALGLESLGQKQPQNFTCICRSKKAVLSKIPKTTIDALIKSHAFISDNLKKHSAKITPLRELERNVEQKGESKAIEKERNGEGTFFTSLFKIFETYFGAK